MSISEKSLSIKSSLLNSEMLGVRRAKEKKAMLIGVFAQFVWAINSIQLKTYRQYFPDAFSNNSLAFWRSVPIWALGYYFSKKNGKEITPHSQIKHKFWFFARSLGNYLGIILWIVFMSYFRVSTCQCICSCSPVIVIFLSILLLKESFYMRYVYGVLICIVGTGIIVLNEKSGKTTTTTNASVDNNNNNNNAPSSAYILVGLLVGVTHLTVLSFTTFGQKILCKQKMSGEVQNYYLGMYNTLPALLIMIIENHYGLSNLLYVVYGLSNGFVFYVGNYYTAKALEDISLSKFVPITYMCNVFVYILGFLFLGEVVYFTDVIGSLMILGFQVYNVTVPVPRRKREGVDTNNDNDNQIGNTNDNDNDSVNVVTHMPIELNTLNIKEEFLNKQ
jgi:drug/metabolite transporter (DMT)-like permease